MVFVHFYFISFLVIIASIPLKSTVKDGGAQLAKIDQAFLFTLGILEFVIMIEFRL